MKPARGFWRAATWLALGGVVFSGCTTAPRRWSAADRAAIYERAEMQFDHAILLKPFTLSATNSPADQLAPLLLVEVSDSNAAGQFVHVPKVFCAESKVTFRGVTYDQVNYCWQTGDLQPGLDGAAAWQGVRITLNAAGHPAIWEVLRDPSGAEVMFVSQNLEAAAVREFGSALPGRRFAVERAVAEAPRVVVARVLDDGPVPMGPIVHLRAGTGDILTLICRCMPSQARQLVGQFGYEMPPVDGGLFDRISSAEAELGSSPRPMGAGEVNAETQVPKLRLPAAF